MTATFVFVLSCLVCGIVAFPPASSYLPPFGSGGGRSAVPSPAIFPSVSPPASSYLPPAKGLTGQHTRISAAPAPTLHRPIGHGAAAKRVSGERTAAQTLRHAVSLPIVQRATASGTAAKPISSPAVGSARSYSNGRQQNGYKIGFPAGSGSRTVGSHAPY